MIPLPRLLSTAFVLGTLPLLAEQHSLHFENGDALTGAFSGIDAQGNLLFQRGGIGEVMSVEPGEIDSLNREDGFITGSIDDPSIVTLTDGSQIPCEIVRFDADTLIIRTPYAPDISISKAQISTISLTPWEGELLYRGPSGIDGWHELLHLPGAPPRSIMQKAADSVPRKATWSYKAGSLRADFPVPISSNLELAERVGIDATVRWRDNQTNTLVAFHCDWQLPPAKDENVEKRRLGIRDRMRYDRSAWPYLFGRSFVLSLQGRYATLQVTHFNADGIGAVKRLTSQTLPQEFMQRREAKLSIRSDRKSGHVAVYIDGKFLLQWHPGPEGFDFPEDTTSNTGLAFAGLSQNHHLELSDITVSSWNGMLDSATSMVSPDVDVALMSNGIDRTGGTLQSIHDGIVSFETPYGLFKIPVGDVAEIQIARNVNHPASDHSERVAVQLDSHGVLFGTLAQSSEEAVRLATPHLGELSIPIADIVSMDFTPEFVAPFRLFNN